MQEHIRIGLLVSSLILGVAASLDVCLRAVADQVVFLAVLQIFEESVIVLGPCRLVAVIGYNSDRVQSVCAHAALHAAAHMVADQLGHQLFLQEVVLGLMDVCAAVDDLTGDMGLHLTYVRVSGVVRDVVALLHDPEAALVAAAHAVQALPVEIYVGAHLLHSLDILFIGSYCHLVLLSYSGLTGVIRIKSPRFLIQDRSLTILKQFTCQSVFRSFSPHYKVLARFVVCL